MRTPYTGEAAAFLPNRRIEDRRRMASGLRVLVVEDTLLIAEFIVDALRGHGYDIVGPVSSLRKALEAARRERIDAALLDIDLDGVDCFDVAEILRIRQIPFGFVTAWFKASSLPPGLRGVPLVSKPFSEEQLMDLLVGGVLQPPAPKKGWNSASDVNGQRFARPAMTLLRGQPVHNPPEQVHARVSRDVGDPPTQSGQRCLRLLDVRIDGRTGSPRAQVVDPGTGAVIHRIPDNHVASILMRLDDF